MTTIVGIKASEGKSGIILASDLAGTSTDWTPQGDIAYRQQTKQEGQKIYVDDKKEIAIAMSGVFDPNYVDFLGSVLKGKTNIRKAITKGFFDELANLNLKRWGGRFPNDNSNSLLIATRFDGKPELYDCWQLGLVENRVCAAIGSGSKYALDYIRENVKSNLIPYYLSLQKGIKLAVSSLDKASADIHTGGLDIVVITPDEIKCFGDVIKRNLEFAKNKSVDEIVSAL